MIRLGAIFFKYRDLLFPLVLFALALGTRPRCSSATRARTRCSTSLGVRWSPCGQAIRALAIGLAYIRRGGKNKQIYAKSLVVGGIFAHCRNPLYVGNLLGIVGLMLIHNGIWMYAIGVPFFVLAYVSIVAEEERYLRGHFGAEYDEYCRRVPRLLAATDRPHADAAQRSVPLEARDLQGVRHDVLRVDRGAGMLLWERFRLDAYGE